MNKKERLEKQLVENNKEISTLQSFRQTKHVKQLVRQLFGEQDFIKKQIVKLQSTVTSREITKQQRITRANHNRSEKMKRSWNYFKAIQKNYPIKMSLREIRSAFTKHKRGLETDVDVVMWRNPSP